MRPLMVNFPLPIVTPRLILRQPIMNYVDCYEYTSAVVDSFKELQPWVPWAQNYPSVEQSEEYIRECCAAWIMKNNNNVGIPFWIIEKASNKFIGSAQLHNIAWDIPRYEIGYWLKTSATRKGYMCEAINALTRYCFIQLVAKRVEIKCETKNERSKKIPIALNFNHDATLKNAQLAIADRKITDTLIFSRTDLTNLPDLAVKWGTD